MQDQTGVSLAKFDVLAQLVRSPDGLSMGKLSSALRVSNGNVSGLVNRLMKDGFVEKIMSDADRRSFTAKLTPLGAERFHQANTAHHEVLSRILQDLSDTELTAATDAVRKVSEKIATVASDGH
ncbi:MAG: MarR family transcriptional regulator [Paracoccaceae bacterium]